MHIENFTIMITSITKKLCLKYNDPIECDWMYNLTLDLDILILHFLSWMVMGYASYMMVYNTFKLQKYFVKVTIAVKSITLKQHCIETNHLIKFAKLTYLSYPTTSPNLFEIWFFESSLGTWVLRRGTLKQFNLRKKKHSLWKKWQIK